jgi:aspartate ammonia-lyase
MSVVAEDCRREQDSLGARELDNAALHGIHALRACENFPQVGRRAKDVGEFAQAFGMVKLAALRANIDCGVFAQDSITALETACVELAGGAPRLVASLVVPLVQGGAGTSTNMNVNEVLANRALEIEGRAHGDYERFHPNDHVNRSQSTNDVYPTALRLALLLRQANVDAAIRALAEALAGRAGSYAGQPKLGRTQLQDAVLLTIDEELLAWADHLRAAEAQILAASGALLDVNLGGTAVGTGLAAPEGFASHALEHLRRISGLPLRSADRLVSATTDPTALLGFSAALRTGAAALAKLADDLRLLSSGPRTGLAEVELPAMQAGSSMMPGKVNPVIPEFVNQLVFRVHGADTTATMALSAGQLQLNAMLPVVGSELFAAQDALRAACEALAARCVDGMRYRVERVEKFAMQGLDHPTRVAASAGYSAAAELVRDALDSGRSPAEIDPVEAAKTEPVATGGNERQGDALCRS